MGNPKGNRLIQDYENTLVKIMLYAIQELPKAFGIHKVARFLKGSKSLFVIENELYELDMYGVLQNFKTRNLKTIISKLLEQGLLANEIISSYRDLPTLRLTRKGEDFLYGKTTINIPFIYEFSDREIILLDEEDDLLYQSLRELRYKLSIKDEVPAYCICQDTPLREMAKFKPKSESGLLSIRGIGEAFVQKYGSLFLSAIKRFHNRMKT